VTLLAAVHAEWTKVATVRSLPMALLAYAVVVFGVSTGVVAGIGTGEAATPGYDAAVLAFYGLNFGHLAVVVFAVLLTAGEYSRHTVHPSLVAVPRRGRLLAAKVGVGTALVLAVAVPTALGTLAGTQALLGSAAVDLGTPGVLRATLAAALYPTLFGAFCMGVGMLLRDQVAALGVLIPFFFLVTPVLELIPVLRTAAQFLPDRAGQVAVRLHGRPVDEFGPVTGLAVLALWALAAVLVAWWVLRRRDA
jgi:ABC-2 type transport system permease protein